MKFYVTEEEKRLIDEKMKQLPIKQYGAYFRKMAIDGYILVVDRSDTNVAAAADGRNQLVGVCALFAGAVDFLRLVLPRNSNVILISFANSAFQPPRRCGGYRLGYCLPIVIILL